MEDLSVGSVLGAGRIPGHRKRLLEGILYPWIEGLQPLLRGGKSVLEFARVLHDFRDDCVDWRNCATYVNLRGLSGHLAENKRWSADGSSISQSGENP